MSTTITNALPDIPRLCTGICEWLACVVYLLIIYRRVPLRRTIAVGLIGLPAMIAIQYFDGVMPIWFWIIGMLLAFAGMWAIILFGTGTGKREGMYIAARAFVLAELVASLHWQLVMFLNLGENPERAQLFSLLLLVVTYAACFTVAWLIERGNFANDAPTVATAQLAIGTGAITIMTFAMSNLSFVSTNTPFSGTVGQEVFYIRTLVDFCGFAILYAQQEQARRMEASAELASINAQLESQHQEYLASKENIESIGRLAHDLKHQIAALRAEVDPEHAAAGFEQLEASVAQASAQQHSGNPVLDVILTTKMRTCADRGITLTAVADGKLLKGMSSMDIASLFGNALDNAIEALRRLDDPQRRVVKLTMAIRGDLVSIRISNYFDHVIRSGNGDLITTKTDPASHGYGVKSIRMIVDALDGDMVITTEDGVFELGIVLPRPH